MKSILANVLAVSIMLLTVNTVYGADDMLLIHTDQVQKGLLQVTYRQAEHKVHKLLIDKDGTRYTYDLLHNSEVQNFPLQTGNGQYEIRIAELVEGNRYKEVLRRDVLVQLADDKAPYLHSIQEIYWDTDSKAVATAAQLIGEMGKELDAADKVYKIYSFLVYNMQYDYDKAVLVQQGYLPDVDQTLADKKGICYDYAALFAAMLRSQGIPAKMVKGYAPNILTYHAWNEVYVESIDRWVTIDTVYDSIMLSHNLMPTIEKDKESFKIEAEL